MISVVFVHGVVDVSSVWCKCSGSLLCSGASVVEVSSVVVQGGRSLLSSCCTAWWMFPRSGARRDVSSVEVVHGVVTSLPCRAESTTLPWSSWQGVDVSSVVVQGVVDVPRC